MVDCGFSPHESTSRHVNYTLETDVSNSGLVLTSCELLS